MNHFYVRSTQSLLRVTQSAVCVTYRQCSCVSGCDGALDHPSHPIRRRSFRRSPDVCGEHRRLHSVRADHAAGRLLRGAGQTQFLERRGLRDDRCEPRRVDLVLARTNGVQEALRNIHPPPRDLVRPRDAARAACFAMVRPARAAGSDHGPPHPCPSNVHLDSGGFQPDDAGDVHSAVTGRLVSLQRAPR